VRLRLLALALLIVAGGSAAAISPASAAPGPLPDRRLGPTPTGTRVDFDLVLRVRRAALDRYLAGLFDPDSPLYGRYLEPAEAGRRFGLTWRALAALDTRLRKAGLRVIGGPADRTSLRVRGTAAAVNLTFGVRLQDFAGRDGRVYHRPDRAPIVPRALARWVEDVAGLDLAPVLHADAARSTLAPFAPVDTKKFYDVTPLHDRKIDGRGQTIALLSVDAFDRTDVDTYAQRYGLTVKPVITKRVGAGNSDTDPFESDMDIEIIRSVAPGVQIVDYQLTPTMAGIAAAIDQVVRERRATIVSGSFGWCDGTDRDSGYSAKGPLRIARGDRSNVENALQTAALAGISFFFSTGDYGGHDCQKWAPKDPLLSAHFPADAPYAVAVGGTVATPAGNGLLDEGAWGDSLSNSGGGGGLNPYDRMLPWQRNVRTSLSNGFRQVPDVAALAGSPWWSVYTVFEGGQASWGGGGGTSAATPFWAASMVLVQQYMLAHRAGSVCFAAPLLYALARGTWKAAPFYDIKTGTNLGWSAGDGWDFATGWGSPDVWNLSRDAVSYRAKHPLPGGSNACRAQIPR
jgi:kumamolisin